MLDRFKCGFFIVLYVVFDFFEDFYNKLLLLMYKDLCQMIFSIYYLFREDCRFGKKIGKVVELFLGNKFFGLSDQLGLDIVVVEFNVFVEKGVFYFVFI